METDLKVNVKVEPNSDMEVSHYENDFKPVEKEEVKGEPIENVAIKLEPIDDEPSSAPESITVKLEPTYYSSGDGHGLTETPSTSQNNSSPSESSSTSKETITDNKPQSFDDLLKLWERNEELEEFGFFFAYCRATDDCGGYYTDTDTSIDSDEDYPPESKDNDESGQMKSKFYFGRNGYQWSKTPVPMYGKIKNDQIPSCTSPGEMNPYNLWNTLIDDTILQEILKWTNVKLAECRTLIRNQAIPHLAELDMIELKAFLGTFLLSVYVNLHIQPLKYIFCDEDGIFSIRIFQCIMTKYRFTSILNCLSFGDPKLENDTSDRNISVLFERFLHNSKRMYRGSGYAVLGETVVPFWGSYDDERFPMKYAESPCRDGFRLPCVFDVKTGYLHDMYVPYVDLDMRDFTKEEKEFTEPTKLALLLTKSLHGTNTNVTCDKTYMSFELIDAFTKRGLTCLGTIAQSCKEIPREFLPSKKRQRGTTLYGYSEDVTLMSHMNKRTKAKIIATSMLNEDFADTQDTQRPKLLKLYNTTKVAYMPNDDNFDRTCHRRTTLVSMALFYKMIDFSIHNAFILYSLNFKRKLKLYKVFKTIANKLCEEHLMRRAVDTTLPDHVRLNVIKCLGSEE